MKYVAVDDLLSVLLDAASLCRRAVLQRALARVPLRAFRVLGERVRRAAAVRAEVAAATVRRLHARLAVYTFVVLSTDDWC